MRKWNTILSVGILLLLVIHGVLGSFSLLGVGSVTWRPLAWILIGLVLAHGVIGVLLTAQSVQVWRQTGAPYWRRNALFWVRRLSGFAILVLLCLHVAAFGYTADGVYRLKWFGTGKLISQLLLVASILIHVGTNCTPLRVALGSRRGKMGDFLLLVSLLLAFMAVGIIVYYVRWNL